MPLARVSRPPTAPVRETTVIRRLKWWILGGIFVALAGFVGFVWFVVLQAGPNDLIAPSETPAGLNIPRTFDDAAMASVELPLVRPDASPVQLSSSYYYRIWIRPIYKSYPIYAPDREPPGYLDWLNQQEPQRVSRRRLLQGAFIKGRMVSRTV